MRRGAQWTKFRDMSLSTRGGAILKWGSAAAIRSVPGGTLCSWRDCEKRSRVRSEDVDIRFRWRWWTGKQLNSNYTSRSDKILQRCGTLTSRRGDDTKTRNTEPLIKPTTCTDCLLLDLSRSKQRVTLFPRKNVSLPYRRLYTQQYKN